MERKESSRHLAAILFTDIVGYTSMMQRDEHQALVLVRRHQSILEALVPAHHGDIYQYYGDGSLSIFSSATEAVQCAFELQKTLLQDPRVLVRTGIHIGEIYTEGGKIFGDGVNIASRIESIGQGGTVLFSRDVFEKIRNQTSFDIRSIGRFEFKNVTDPIEVFALAHPAIRVPDLNAIEGKLRTPSAKKRPAVHLLLSGIILVLMAGYFLAWRSSGNTTNEKTQTHASIAVLPFKNWSEDSSEDYLSIGIAEDILTQLAQIKGLKVISGSSSMRYKSSDKAIKTIARELDVKTILEGSIRIRDHQIRVSVQLTHGLEERLLWAADFDRQMVDVLNVQRDIALAVSDKLKIALSPEVKNRLADKIHVHPEAYVNYQKGQDLLLRSSGSKEDVDKAIRHFEIAIRADSTFSKAWVGLGDAYLEAVFWHRIETDTALTKAKTAAAKALALDPGLGEGYGLLGSIAFHERNFTDGQKHLHQAIDISPNYTLAYERLAWIYLVQGNVKDGLRYCEKMIELDPLSTRVKGSLGNAYALLGRYEEGIRRMEEYLRSDPTDNHLLWTLGYLQARHGQYLQSIATLNKRSIGTKTNWVLGYCYAKTGNTALAEEFLQTNLEKSKTGFVPHFMLAVQFNALGYTEKALEYLDKGIDDLGENFFVLSLDSDPMLESLRSNPEFKRLVAKARNELRRG